MIKLSEIFHKLFKKKGSESLADVDYLRNDFKSRYHSFQVLLSSNNKALEIMADIELLLEGKKPFGITHIKSHCTAASVNVFKMIKNFDELAPGKYTELFSRFNDIQLQINLLLSQKKPVTDNRLIIPLALVNKSMADIIGSKMANIGEIKNKLNLTVPPGFVITSAAYDKLLSHNDLQTEIDRLFQTTDTEDMEQLYSLSSKIRQMIMNSKVPKELEDRISESLAALENRRGKKLRLALRSSAIGEDTAKNTFAGLYHSELNVGSDNIIEAYKNVVAGKYSLQAITYRLERGFRDEDILMSVGCMEMVDAIAGGVMYTRNPVNMSDDYVFINSAWGLPKSVVDGSID
ncbi:MAG: PEP/pyruvate-binding domain-containing protein, partial [Proteobacteria bacterium]|nr:PEP/pyruvate-binding domain-containing protein [Pseudomonadota bacterium]